MAEAAKIVLDFDVKMTKFGAAQNGYSLWSYSVTF